MNSNKIYHSDRTTFALSGRLDTISAPKLQNELLPEFDTAKHIELDFAELVYVSSAGLRVLLSGEKTAKEKGGKMTLVNVSQDVMEVFDMTGFSDILNIE